MQHGVLITKVLAQEVFDSRGNPTVSCLVGFSDGSEGLAYVPSGASTGSLECVEIRDHDASRFLGKGVQKAVCCIEKLLAPKLLGKQVCSQQTLDTWLCELDGCVQKSNMGGNAILALSLAYARCTARSLGLSLCDYFTDTYDIKQPHTLPVPFMNMINGGAHAENGLFVQEFMIVPFAFASFSEAVRAGAEIMYALGKRLQDVYGLAGRGDEGGFAPPSLQCPEHALDALCKAIEQAGYSRDQVGLALDIAATEFYSNKGYCLDGKQHVSAEVWQQRLLQWVDDYAILSVEDAMAEHDAAGWQALTARAPSALQLVGDDAFVTQSYRLEEAAEQGIANSILIKPNQVGTVSEVANTLALAKQLGYLQMLSHRSGETEDTSICDMAVAWSTGQIKMGPPKQTDRTCKYNRLLWLEKERRLPLSTLLASRLSVCEKAL